MYSYEDRLRAVRLYIKLGKRVGLTIRQLGYPTKNALKNWHREFEQRLDLPTGYVRRPGYSKAQKELAVQHYLDNGRCLAAAIRALGYPSRTLLSAWVHELHPQARTRVVGPSRELSPAVKQAAVIALCMRQASAPSVARELGVSPPTLYDSEASATRPRRTPYPSKTPARFPTRALNERSSSSSSRSLRRDIRRLATRARTLLKKANELLEEVWASTGSVLDESGRRHSSVHALRLTYALTDLLQEVGLPAQLPAFTIEHGSEVADKHAEVRRVMTHIFERNYRCYGYRRMHASLIDGSPCNISEKVVRLRIPDQRAH